MTGTRIKDLAQALKQPESDIITQLKDLGVTVADAESVVDPTAAALLYELVGINLKRIALHRGCTIRELAQSMEVPVNQVQQRLMQAGVLAGVNQTLPIEQIESLALDFQCLVEWQDKPQATVAPSSIKQRGKSAQSGPQPRPPVVTILGHVDHGKTTLLDAIRNTAVAEGEAGGITQRIGAYQVEVNHQGTPALITFLDTPGHAAFSSMRERGTRVTDIAVLVVAADDGVMPQTREAISHAKAADVPIVVAVNKIDKDDANPDRVRQELAEFDLVPEEWGGQTQFVNISAKKNLGLDALLESILVQAEVLELTADPNANPEGVVIESRVDKGRGTVATIIVQQGTFKVGDIAVAGASCGRIKRLCDERGRPMKKATPSTPVELIGLKTVPSAGDLVQVTKDERSARQLAQARESTIRRIKQAEQPPRMTLKGLRKQIEQGVVQEVRVIVKGDLDGTVEAVCETLERLEHPEVKVRVLHSNVGNVTSSDVDHADATNSLIVAFSVKAEPDALSLAERKGIEIRAYDVIYNLEEDMIAAMRGMLAPTIEERELGRAEVRQVFSLPRGTVAGCYVVDGRVQRNTLARVLRGKEVSYEGKIASLRHLKDDVREMAQGFECGIVLEHYTDVQEGDIIVSFERIEVARADRVKLREYNAAPPTEAD